MPNSTPSTLDPRFRELHRRLSSRPEGSPPLSEEEAEGTHAAVSLIVRGGPELEVLLIRRAESKGDPWSGHMALPGGRRDPADGDLVTTAIRETLEETGLDLKKTGARLGSLEALQPNTFRLPPIAIYPFVFGVPAGTGARVASSEIVEVLWVPLSYLASPEAAGQVRIPLGEASKEFPCLRVGEREIWGLTYRILQDFLPTLEEDPDAIPGADSTD